MSQKRAPIAVLFDRLLAIYHGVIADDEFGRLTCFVSEVGWYIIRDQVPVAMLDDIPAPERLGGVPVVVVDWLPVTAERVRFDGLDAILQARGLDRAPAELSESR